MYSLRKPVYNAKEIYESAKAHKEGILCALSFYGLDSLENARKAFMEADIVTGDIAYEDSDSHNARTIMRNSVEYLQNAFDYDGVEWTECYDCDGDEEEYWKYTEDSTHILQGLFWDFYRNQKGYDEFLAYVNNL